MKKSNTKFGEFVRNERFRLGLTCIEFAKKIGISQVQLSNIETGKCLPRINGLDRYVDGLGVEKSVLTELWLEDYAKLK